MKKVATDNDLVTSVVDARVEARSIVSPDPSRKYGEKYQRYQAAVWFLRQYDPKIIQAKFVKLGITQDNIITELWNMATDAKIPATARIQCLDQLRDLHRTCASQHPLVEVAGADTEEPVLPASPFGMVG